jgi:hypothetical protein
LQHSGNTTSLVKPWNCDECLNFPFRYSIKRSAAYSSEKIQDFLSHYKSWELHRINSILQGRKLHSTSERMQTSCYNILHVRASFIVGASKEGFKQMIKSVSQCFRIWTMHLLSSLKNLPLLHKMTNFYHAQLPFILNHIKHLK